MVAAGLLEIYLLRSARSKLLRASVAIELLDTHRFALHRGFASRSRRYEKRQTRRSDDFHGGEGGIRTLDTLADIPPFQGGALDHYATPPTAPLYRVI